MATIEAPIDKLSARISRVEEGMTASLVRISSQSLGSPPLLWPLWPPVTHKLLIQWALWIGPVCSRQPHQLAYLSLLGHQSQLKRLSSHFSIFPSVVSLSQVPPAESPQPALVEHMDDPYLALREIVNHLASMERNFSAVSGGQLDRPPQHQQSSQSAAGVATPLPAFAAVLQTASAAMFQPGKDLQSGPSGSGSGQQFGQGGQAEGSAQNQQAGLGGSRPVCQTEGSAQKQQDKPGGSGQDGAWLSGVWRQDTGGKQHESQPSGAGGDPFPVEASARTYLGPSEPLGSHLSEATRERICKGEFVDLFTLLYREPQPKQLLPGLIVIMEREQHKVTRTWNNWFSGYMVYAAVLLRAHPLRGVEMFVYASTIYRIHTSFVGPAWLEYDEAFHTVAARHPETRWDEVNLGLRVLIMTRHRAVEGTWTTSGHGLASRQGGQSGQHMAGSKGQNRMVCWKFNALGKCFRARCRFKHECRTCAGNHPSTACPRGSSFKRMWPRKRKGAGGPSYAGGKSSNGGALGASA